MQALQLYLSVILTSEYVVFQSFVALFKAAEKQYGSKRHSSPLEPLLWESFDALDQSKYVNYRSLF